jgi:hypothetical protein
MTVCNHRCSERERERERERESTIHEHIMIHSRHQKDVSCSAHTALYLKDISTREKSKVTSLTWPKTCTAGSCALPSIYQSEITEANIKKLKACKQILISLYGTWHLMIDRMHIVKSTKKNQDSDHENWSPKKPLLRLKTLQVIALDTFTQRNKTC